MQGTRRPGSGSQRPCQPATSGHWINIHSFLEPTLAHCLGHRIKMADRVDHKIYLLFPTRLINLIISGKNVIVANIRWISDQNEFPMEMSIKRIIPSGNASLAWSHKGPKLQNRFLTNSTTLRGGSLTFPWHFVLDMFILTEVPRHTCWFQKSREPPPAHIRNPPARDGDQSLPP